MPIATNALQQTKSLFEHLVGAGEHGRRHGGKVRVSVSRKVTADEGGNRCGATDQMRRGVVLLVAIVLGGCLPDQAKDVATCQTEADRFYQSYRAVDVDDPRSHYIIACMAAKGYDFIISPADCNSQHPLASQAACYAPNSWLAVFIDQFRPPLK